MIDTHYILIYCIICIYGLELIGLTLKYQKDISRNIKLFKIYLLRRTKKMFTGSHASDNMCDEIIDIIEKKHA